MNSLAKKWQEDRLLSFLKGILFLAITSSVISLILYGLSDVYIDVQGVLHEKFYLLGFSYIFAFVAIIAVIIIIFKKILKKY